MDDEREQIEQIRVWWSDYGNYVIAGVVLGALALFGYSYFKSSQQTSAVAASALYQELADEVTDGDIDAARSLADQLIAEYGNTAYAAQARLAMARIYMDRNRDQDAADALQGLLDSKADDQYRQVAKLRLARIYLYQEKAAEALELLGAPGGDEGAFAARFDEARGDAHVAVGDHDAAREAYRRALAESGRETTVNQEFVQLKLLDLPIEAVAEASQPALDETIPAGDVAGSVEELDTAVEGVDDTLEDAVETVEEVPGSTTDEETPE